MSDHDDTADAESSDATEGRHAGSDESALRRARPLFDNRPAVLKNPAALPEPGERKDPVEAAFEKATEDLAWLDKKEPTEEERAARRERREAHKKKVRRQRRLRRALVVVAAGLSVLLVLGLVWYQYIFGGLDRMPRVAGQAGADTPGENFLVVGTNPSEPVADRNPRLGWGNDFANSDLVMLLHLDRDKHSMYVISIPGSSAVEIPGRGAGKLSDAYAVGGAKLYVRTVEELTGIRLDRVMTIDLNAFKEMTDILGGVTVNVPSAVCDEPKEPRRLDGAKALEYIALRSCMPGKDLDRVARQQSLMKALMRGAVDGGTVTHPVRVNKLLRAGASGTTLEKGFGFPSMLGSLWGMRHLRTSNTTFLTVPTADDPIATVDGVDYVRLDKQKSADLWDAVRADQIAQYLQLSGVPTS